MLPTSTVFLFLLLLFLSVKCLLCARNWAEFLSEMILTEARERENVPLSRRGAEHRRSRRPRGGWDRAPAEGGVRSPAARPRPPPASAAATLRCSPGACPPAQQRPPWRGGGSSSDPTGPWEVWPERLCLLKGAGTPSGDRLPRSPLPGTLPPLEGPLRSPPPPLEGAFATHNYVVIRS